MALAAANSLQINYLTTKKTRVFLCFYFIKKGTLHKYFQGANGINLLLPS